MHSSPNRMKTLSIGASEPWNGLRIDGKFDALFAFIHTTTTENRPVHEGMKGWSDDDQSELFAKLITSVSSICFQAMVDGVGMDATLKAIWPHSKHGGMAMAQNARKRFSIDNDDILAISLPLYWTDGAVARGRCSPLRIFEDGALAEIHSCPLKEGPAMLCYAMSHGIAEGISESVNPDFRITFTHHLPNDDEFCRWIVHRKSADARIEDLGPEVDSLKIDYLDDEKQNLGDHCSGEMLMWLSRASQDLGLEDIISESTRKPLMELGASLIDTLKEPHGVGSDTARASALISGLSGMLRRRTGTVEVSLNDVKGETTYCPFKTGTELTCEMMEHLFSGFCGAMDPPCAFIYSERSRSEGMPCQWRAKIINLKNPDSRDLDNDSMDAISILKLRLAKGEISEQEYERKAGLLAKY